MAVSVSCDVCPLCRQVVDGEDDDVGDRFVDYFADDDLDESDYLRNDDVTDNELQHQPSQSSVDGQCIAKLSFSNFCF